jgi:putative multiple sugar transport system permease protein
MLIFKGLALALLQGQSVGPFPLQFQRISTGFLPDPFGGADVRVLSLIVGIILALGLVGAELRKRRKAQAHDMDVEPVSFFVVKNLLFVGAVSYLVWLLSTYKGLPNVLILMAVLILIYQFVTNRTTIGRRIYALGGNEKAARLSGVNTARLSFFTFVNMGVLAAVAGLIFAARLNTATPKAGLGFELDVIAACFIGGASASGGVGKVVGAVIGAFIMGVMNNGMSIMGIGIDYQQVIKGMVLLAAVFLDVYNRNRA